MKAVPQKYFRFAICLLLVLSVSCGHKKKNVAQVPPAPRPVPHPQKQQQPPQPLPVGYVEEGIASWYGIPFNGRHAADGEIYDMETLVAAHKLMPFNTWLRVTNLANGKTVNVRIIDRGPFVEGRIIDLSKAAARQINMLEAGISRVRLEVIAAPRDIASNDFYAIQVGVFTSQTNAEQVRAQFAQRYGMAQILVRHGAVISYRVLVGKFSTVDDARQLANIISGENPDIFIVRLDETPVAPVTNPPPNFPAPPQH
jgi:rare lipoprotein A